MSPKGGWSATMHITKFRWTRLRTAESNNCRLCSMVWSILAWHCIDSFHFISMFPLDWSMIAFLRRVHLNPMCVTPNLSQRVLALCPSYPDRVAHRQIPRHHLCRAGRSRGRDCQTTNARQVQEPRDVADPWYKLLSLIIIKSLSAKERTSVLLVNLRPGFRMVCSGQVDLIIGNCSSSESCLSTIFQTETLVRRPKSVMSGSVFLS